jgi:hypothetical protein
MKPTLIALALTGLLANAAFAEPTLTGDDAYDAVHLVPWKNAPEATSYQATTPRAMEVRPEIHEGIYSFNP